jgi:hypothetical protein
VFSSDIPTFTLQAKEDTKEGHEWGSMNMDEDAYMPY